MFNKTFPHEARRRSGRMGRDAQYNNSVHTFIIREFMPTDFETLWRIDQDCFPPGISYSRQELKTYMRRRGSFTLVAVEG